MICAAGPSDDHGIAVGTASVQRRDSHVGSAANSTAGTRRMSPSSLMEGPREALSRQDG